MKRLLAWARDVREYGKFALIFMRVTVRGSMEAKLTIRNDGVDRFEVYFDPITVPGETRVVVRAKGETVCVMFRRDGRYEPETADEEAYEKLRAIHAARDKGEQ